MKRYLFGILLFVFVFALAGCYSCETWNNLWGTGPVEPSAAHKFFFDSDCKPITAKAPAHKPAPKLVIRKAEPAPVTGKCGASSTSRSLPCENCGVVKITKKMPAQVALNAPFSYEIMVSNLTRNLVTDVVVTEVVDSKFKYSSSSPSANARGNELVWTMAELDAGQTKTIKVTGMATGTECVKTCATVEYLVPACASVQVVQPALKLVKVAPSEVTLCEPIPVKITVTNTGTGMAKDVKVTDNLPAGLTTDDGKRSVTLDAGTLAAGQSKTFTMNLKAGKTGKYVNTASATSSDGLRAQASTTTVVRQPVLAITKSAPEKRYLGRNVTFDITVSNKGDADAKNTVVEDAIPSGTKFVSATGGGQLTGEKVTWNLGTLKPGASRKVSLTVMPSDAGRVSNIAKATAVCTDGVSSAASTMISGIPAVLLEVIDLDDPVELGSNTTYVITATNQGSMAGTNIKIECTLEDNEQFVSASGATRGSAIGNKVVFEPLSSLAPKAKATWRVVVKAVKEGDVRFKVTMNTDQITRPVEETESTNLYE
jgi:uncharacterized repeat protein (TIGR01451 family)